MNVMQKPRRDLLYGTVPGPRTQMVRFFFGLHRYEAERCCKNPRVPEATRNVNPARE